MFLLVVMAAVMAAAVFTHARVAHAGSIINRPLYLGLQSGLLGYWSFDGPTISGTRVNDLSGNGNHGTLMNGPKPVVGKMGQGLKFDGNDAVTVGKPDSLNNLGAMTVSAWLYYTGAINESVTVVDKRLNGWYLNLPNANGNYIFYRKGVVGNVSRRSGYNTVRVNSWVHLAATSDGTDNGTGIRIYIDGSEASYALTSSGSGGLADDSGLDLCIGGSSNGASGRPH
jgi:hypothetical protein